MSGLSKVVLRIEPEKGADHASALREAAILALSEERDAVLEFSQCTYYIAPWKIVEFLMGEQTEFDK